MKFLLVNINAAVKKIFSIASRKAGISLDFVGSLGDISMQEDYDCIFIDDGVLHTGNFQHIKNKMINTKFCLIISKDSQMVHGFDNYIRKPFLPTDIYEALKQEKHNDMKFSSFDTEMDDISLKTDIDLLDEMHHSDMNVGININNIDLSGFDDNDDEFLSGIKSNAITDQSSDEIMIKPNEFINDDDEIKFTYDDLGTNATNGTSDDFIQIKDSIDISQDDLAQDALVEDIDVQDIDIKADDDTNQDDIDIIENTSIQSDAKADVAIDDDDDIDFSSVFAMQEEFEKDHRKPKGLIGGDIYTKKEPPKLKDMPSKDISSDIKPHSISPIIGKNLTQESIQETTRESLQKPLQEFLHESTIDNANIGIQEEDIINFDELDSLSGVDFDDELNLIDEDFKTDQNATFEGTQDPLNSDFSDDFNIGGLSDDDLNSLDDEALLKPQEKPAPLDGPKILNKSDIDEVTHILEDTQNIHDNAHVGDVKIANSRSDSITHEAFSEAIDETNVHTDFSFDDDLPSDVMQEETLASHTQISPNEPPSTTTDNPAPNVISNPNLDLTEIIKSFPIDKLRELLSGVQITINITFPTKK